MTFQESEEKGDGAEGARTPGLLIANQPLSQLSYSPMGKIIGVFKKKSSAKSFFLPLTLSSFLV